MIASSRDGNVRSMFTTAPAEGLSVRENVSLVPRIVPVESMPYAPFASAVQPDADLGLFADLQQIVPVVVTEPTYTPGTSLIT